MPRYRTEHGAVVNIPAEKAARINGLTPLDAPSPTPRRRPRKKVTHASGNGKS